MNKTAIITVSTIAVLAVAGAGFALNQNMDKQPATSTASSMPAGHSAQLDELKSLNGDAYDTQFIAMMSEHHAGAVAMAQAVDTESAYPETRNLAQRIIVAQTKELAGMKAWSEKWGYTYTEPSASAVSAMTSSFKGKTGPALDKQFLSEMIGHHNGAVDMAVLSSTRAAHNEIKELSVNIMADQTKEIAEMKQINGTYGFGDDGGSMSGMDHGSNSMQDSHN